MRIIGQTDGGYLIEATGGELEEIAGYDVATAMTRGSYRRSPIGVEFDISKAWRRIHDLNLRHDDLGKAAGAMRALADLLTDKLEVVALPPEPKADANG